jgi:hypothetical protein
MIIFMPDLLFLLFKHPRLVSPLHHPLFFTLHLHHRPVLWILLFFRLFLRFLLTPWSLLLFKIALQLKT